MFTVASASISSKSRFVLYHYHCASTNPFGFSYWSIVSCQSLLSRQPDTLKFVALRRAKSGPSLNRLQPGTDFAAAGKRQYKGRGYVYIWMSFGVQWDPCWGCLRFPGGNKSYVHIDRLHFIRSETPIALSRVASGGISRRYTKIRQPEQPDSVYIGSLAGLFWANGISWNVAK